MTFLNPPAIWFLLLIPLVVGLYFFRQRKRALTVPALFLWEEALGQSSTRRFFRRLRHLWLLLLGMLAILLLTGALSRPEFQEWLVQRRHLVLVLDNSLSMGRAGPNGEQVLRQAKAKARLAVQQLPRETRAAVLQTHPPQVVQGFSADRAALLRAIDEIPLSAAETEPDKTRMLVDALAASRPDDVETLLLTDSSQSPVEFATPVRVVALEPASGGNLALTAFGARARLEDPSQVELYAEIRNFGAATTSAQFDLEIAGQSVEARQIALEPGETERVALSYLYQPGRTLNFAGLARARLQNTGPPDALPLDDAAYAVLPEPRILRVLLVSQGNWFLENFLKADALVTYELLQPDAFSPDIAGGFDLVIFDRRIMPDTQGNLPENWLALGAAPGELLGEDAEPVSGAITQFPETAPDLPNAQPLAGVRVVEALNLREAADREGVTVVARFGESNAPALVLLENEPAGRGAVLAFPLGASDFPLRFGFPLFLRELLFWTANQSAAAPTGLADRGLGEDPPPDWQPLALKEDTRAGIINSGVSVEIAQPGFLLLENRETGEEQWIAINALNPAESAAVESTIPPTPETASPATTANWAERLPAPFPDQPPWVWIAIAGALLLCLEWIVFSRRQTLPQPP